MASAAKAVIAKNRRIRILINARRGGNRLAGHGLAYANRRHDSLPRVIEITIWPTI
jgi:hypothetical protein